VSAPPPPATVAVTCQMYIRPRAGIGGMPLRAPIAWGSPHTVEALVEDDDYDRGRALRPACLLKRKRRTVRGRQDCANRCCAQVEGLDSPRRRAGPRRREIDGPTTGLALELCVETTDVSASRCRRSGRAGRLDGCCWADGGGGVGVGAVPQDRPTSPTTTAAAARASNAGHHPRARCGKSDRRCANGEHCAGLTLPPGT